MAGSQESRFSLNIYLLKGSPDSARGLIDYSGLTESFPVPLGQGREALLYYGRVAGPPDWLKRLFSLSGNQGDPPEGSSVSGLLPIEVEGRLFVVTFGHAWQKMKANLVESNFGIRCVLNLADVDALRAIRRDRIAEESLQAIEQIPDNDGISRFGIDVEKDLLRGVKARIDFKKNFGSWVAGGDSFKASICLAEEALFDFLVRCLGVYQDNSYKSRFEWVDNIVPLRDALLEKELRQELARQVSKRDTAITMSVPDLLSWDDHDYFSFERKRRGQPPVANHLDLSHWVGFANSCGIEIDDVGLLENKIYAYRQGGLERESWSVLDCLHGIVQFNNKIYLAHAGHWFILQDDFVRRTDAGVSKIPYTKISLPKAGISEKEGDYNDGVANTSGGMIMCMDKKLIHFGGGASKFEVCDLLSQDGKMVCVKKWGGGSGSLSHLFYQAKNSITLINGSHEYRDKVRSYVEKSAPEFVQIWNYICKYPDDVEVILAVMHGCKKESLPFFAKLSLLDCVNSLRNMRYESSYYVIDTL